MTPETNKWIVGARASCSVANAVATPVAVSLPSGNKYAATSKQDEARS